MGGKKRGKARQQQRTKEAAEELIVSTTTAGKVIENKKDDELFIIDTVGDTTNRLPSTNKTKTKTNPKHGMPKQLGYKVQKIIDQHNPSMIQRMAQEARAKTDLSTLKRQQKKLRNTNFDLWEDSNMINVIDPTYNPNAPHSKTKSQIKYVPSTKGTSASLGGTAPVQMIPQTKAQLQNPTLSALSKSNQKKDLFHQKIASKREHPQIAVDVALPGQSYLPDKEQHQDVIGEALTIEIKRKEAEEERRASIGGDGMNEETLAILVPDSDESVSDSDSDDDNDDDENATNRTNKKIGKISTSKRNKQKRARQQELAAKARKKQKQMLHSITEVKKIQKSLNQKERERMEKKHIVEQLKSDDLSKPLGTQLYTKLADVDPLNVPSLPVALTEEMEHNNQSLYSLRTVKPKGSLLKERLDSLVDRKMANRKSTKKRRVMQGKKRKPGKGNEIFC